MALTAENKSHFNELMNAVASRVNSLKNIMGSSPMFYHQTKTIRESLANRFLSTIENPDNRQAMNCSCCLGLIKKYGDLVVVNGDRTEWVLWPDVSELSPGNIHIDFLNRVNEVTTFKVTQPLKVENAYMLGTPKNFSEKWDKEFEHLHFQPPAGSHLTSDYALNRFIKQKADFYRDMKGGFYDKDLIKLTTNVVKHKTKHLVKRTLAVLEDMLVIADKVTDQTHMTVTIAENGYRKVKNTSLGELMMALKAGENVDAAVGKYDAMTDSLHHQRPQAPAKDSAIDVASRRIAELGYTDSLKRRLATMDDVEDDVVWQGEEEATPEESDDPFDKLKSTAQLKEVDLGISKQSFTIREFIAFLKDHNATSFKTPELPYGGIVTNAVPDCKPIVKGGGHKSWSVLTGRGFYIDSVDTIVELPAKDNSHFKDYEGYLFVAKYPTHDKWLNLAYTHLTKSSALFPEIVVGELYDVRRVLEMYSEKTPMVEVEGRPVVGNLIQSSIFTSGQSVLMRGITWIEDGVRYTTSVHVTGL